VPIPESVPAPVTQHPMKTRLHDNIIKVKEFTDGTIRYAKKSKTFVGSTTIRNPTTAEQLSSAAPVSEPENLKEALGSP
jgi:hypothetical protein